MTGRLCSYLLPVVQQRGHTGSDAQQDPQHPGQVDVNEVAQLLEHHVDDVQQAVLTAERQNGARVCIRDRFLHRRQTGP